MSKELTIWTVYHRDEQIEQYGLKETDTRKLYNVQEDDGIDRFNDMNPAWSELVAIYNIWRTKRKSEHIGINHYRRQFEPERLPNIGECCCYAKYNFGDTILDHYGKCHHREDLQAVINYIETNSTPNNKYSHYLKTHTTLLGNMCFVMTWYDFNDMCEWLFPILFDVQDLLIGKTYSDSIRLKLWREKAVRDFGEERADYQMRTISFIGERLVSAWIATNMKVIQISAVNPQP